jgi:hypothetical protein
MAKVVKMETKPQSEVRIYNQETAVAQIKITVRGVYPLMTHNPSTMGQGQEAKRGSRIPEAEVEAEAGTYRLEDGSCAIKGESFRGCILDAAGAWKAKRSTMKSRLSHITIVEELLQLRHHDETPITSYEIDARRAVIKKQGIIRRRPKYAEWQCDFTVQYDPVLVPEPLIIVDIAADAGGRIGVGDYRPQKNGPFGRFKVISYQLL